MVESREQVVSQAWLAKYVVALKRLTSKKRGVGYDYLNGQLKVYGPNQR